MRSSFRLILGIAIFAASGWAAADPPSRAARLGYLSGAVSLSPAGERDWVQATLNRPLTTGDRLWADADSRAEVQVGGAALRMGASTSVTLLNLDDNIAQVQLTQGTLKVRVRRLAPGQAFEIDTPNLAFTLRQPGEYRIEADPLGDATVVMVRSGQGEVYGNGASYVVDSRQGYRFTGTGLRDYQPIAAQRDDGFDRWAGERDRRSEYSESARYVSNDVVGYEDLDNNGTWRTDPGYGNVWVPGRVAADWTPYREGHWAWVDPWGWTWVDDAPWGYAVSHYGRWANLGGTWGWGPGPVAARAVYAPALVAFLGGSNFRISISLGWRGDVGWFPLAPRDVYVPSYAVSPSYFHNINRSNTAINATTITNVFNTTIVNKTTNLIKINYANQQVPGAVVAVPTAAFVRAYPVARAAVPVSKDTIANSPVSAVAAAVPISQSVHGAGAPGARPPFSGQAIVAHSTPPAAPVGLAARQPQLALRPGRPLDPADRKELKPIATMTAPPVSVAAESLRRPKSVLPQTSPLQIEPSPTASLPVPKAQPPLPPPQPGKSDQFVTSGTPTRQVARPRVASPPVASMPVRFVQVPRQGSANGQRDHFVTSGTPSRQVAWPPVASPPFTPPTARPPLPFTQAQQRAAPQTARAAAPQVTPAPVQPPAPPAQISRSSPPSRVLQQPARKPGHEGHKSVEQKKA